MNDEDFIRKTFALARMGLGTTWPNPMVGAVIVKNGKITLKISGVSKLPPIKFVIAGGADTLTVNGQQVKKSSISNKLFYDELPVKTTATIFK